MYIYIYIGFSGDSDGKESAHRARPGFNPWVGKIPLRREWLPTPIFSSGEFHGQRSLGELQSMGLQTVRHHWVTSAHTHTHTHTHFLCLTLCDPMDCSPPRLLCSWDFPGKNTGMVCNFLLQGIFPDMFPGCSQTRDPALAGRSFMSEPQGKPLP